MTALIASETTHAKSDILAMIEANPSFALDQNAILESDP